MYVQPFWSFDDRHGIVQVTNHLTGASALVDPAFVEQMEHIFAGNEAGAPDVAIDDVALELAIQLKIVFPDRATAFEWMDARLVDSNRELPLIDQIELTNRCPYACRMCPRTSSMTRGLGDMAPELFERIIREISGHQSYLGLHHFGESLLHRYLPDFVAFARSHGISTGLSCNPPTLRPHLAERLLQAGIASMLLSLDSLNSEKYSKIRGPAAIFEKADRHLRALVRLRDAGDYRTALTLQMIQMRENVTEAQSFLTYCAEVGVDRGVVIRLGRWDFTDDKVEQLGEPNSPLHTAYCLRPSSSIVIMWDGRVVPCCHDYDGLVVLGSVASNSLAEIWGSQKAKQFRLDPDASLLCQTCAFGRPFRDGRRNRLGFRHFHKAPSDDAPRLEWINRASRRDGLSLFSGFDIAAG